MPKTNADVLYEWEARAVLEPLSIDDEDCSWVAVPVEFSGKTPPGGRTGSVARAS